MMSYSKSLAFIGLALAAPAYTDGFAVVSPSRSAAPRSPVTLLAATRDPNDERAPSSDAIRNFAAISAITLGLLFPSADALAVQDTASRLPLNDHALHSSTVGLSVEIKTMDFSLPSSYDNLSDPVASGQDELVQIETVNAAGKAKAKSSGTSTKKESKTKESKTKESKKTESDGPSISAKEKSAAAMAERVAQREAKEAEQAERDAQAIKDRDESIKAARLEKIAAREAAKAEKAAAEAASQEDAKFKGAKFVDDSMPKY